MTTSTWLAPLLLAAYVAAMVATARYATARRRAQSLTTYHAADRRVGSVVGGLSIASTWVWAPALFVSATQAYTNGWVGVLWFTIPNAAALLIMVPFAMKIRERYPEGFTLSGLMRRRYGRPVQRLYTLELGGLAVLSMAVNLLAGGTVVSLLTGLPLAVTSVVLLAAVLAYTYRYGILGGLSTDVLQYALIVGTLAAFVPSLLTVKGADVLTAGLNGINNVTGFFTGGGPEVAVTFGIISAIGLAAGPVGDQTFWQRAFSLREDRVGRAFLAAAAAFAVVPILMTTFGFVAAGEGKPVTDPGYVNLEVIEATFPTWATLPFLFMVVSALLSTVNSQMLAVATLASDTTGDLSKQRLVMVGAGVLAVLVANVPGNTVTAMFLVYSTLRSATFLVTVGTLRGAAWNPQAVAWGIRVALAAGLPLTIYSNFISGAWQDRLTAILVTTFLPVVAAWAGSRRNPHPQDAEPTFRTEAEIAAAAGR